MMAIIVSEFRQWSAKHRRWTMGMLILSVAAFSCFTGLRPEFLFTGIMIAFIWLGIRVGDRSCSEVDLETWVNKTSLTPIKVISGKISATFIILSLHYFIILPIIILATKLWGIEWWIVIEINIMILIVTLLVTSFSMVFRPSENANMFLSSSFLVGILFVTLVLPKISYFNPFYQIWMIAKPGVNKGIWACIFINLGLLFFMIEILYLIFAREVKNKNERRNDL